MHNYTIKSIIEFNLLGQVEVDADVKIMTTKGQNTFYNKSIIEHQIMITKGQNNFIFTRATLKASVSYQRLHWISYIDGLFSEHSMSVQCNLG